jgi:hypothetical protein
MLKLIQRLLGRAPPQNTLPPFNFARNRYPAKKKWPPQLMQLTERQQFRFERKFKRRLQLKSFRPGWDKWVKITMWTLIGTVTIYSVLFHDFTNDAMNPRPGEQPFKSLRDWLKRQTSGFWSYSKDIEEARERGFRRAPGSNADVMEQRIGENEVTQRTGRS